MKHFLTTVNAYVLHLAAAHDRFLSAVDPFVTLKVRMCACVRGTLLQRSRLAMQHWPASRFPCCSQPAPAVL
jgi:hypothetical protein